ncbi:MAG TPA: DUF262 domain-containing protein [Anaerolineae bacterium]|nr:DUF262 domain-containing protein [Anaerolineae bacterium]
MMTPATQPQTIESLDLSLKKIFSDFYVVPSYQREYVWEGKQVEQLLLDIYDAFPESGQPTSQYFIGSIVVCPGEDTVLELIDGQQRVTTAYLFLCAIRDYLAELQDEPLESLPPLIAAAHMDDIGREVYRPRVSLQYEDSVGVLEAIASGGEDVASIRLTTRSVTNIVRAYETIRAFLVGQFGQQASEVRRFFSYFINHVKLVRIRTQDVAHALKVFETINDRGVGLDSMDLLKNLMFMRADKPDFDRLKDRWKGLVDTLHRAGEKPLRFLRYFIFSSYEVDRLREDQIYGWFVENRDLCGYTSDPVGFVNRLHNAAEAYTKFVSGQNIDGSPNRYLANLRHLSGAARQQLILLLAGRYLSLQDFTELSRQLENLFFCYIVTREPTKEFERGFALWARELRRVDSTEGLKAFIDTHFRPAKQELSARFELAFQDLSESRIQKYRMRYILGKTTQYINELAYGATEINLAQFVDSRDVEHILPQTPTPETIASFDKPEEIENYVHRLGNMTMLENAINSSLGNKAFDDKKDGYEKSHFLLTRTIAQRIQLGDTRIDLAVQGLLTFDDWTSESIEKRQIMLAKLARSVWDMPLAQEEQLS